MCVARDSVGLESVLNRERTSANLLSHFVVIYPGLWLSRVLGVLPGFRKIGVELLDPRVLVAMSELAPHARVSVLLGGVLFECALTTILISMRFHE